MTCESCGFFCIVLDLINHRLCGTERGSDGSHQDNIYVLKFTYLHAYMRGFFCIVLNLVDNREWVGWVGLLPTLIGKPVDELENLAWQVRISLKCSLTIMQFNLSGSYFSKIKVIAICA